MRSSFLLVLVLVLIVALLGSGWVVKASPQGADPQGSPRAEPGGTEKIAPEVQAAMDSRPATDLISVIVSLTDQADLSELPGPSGPARQEGTIRALQAKANASQRALRAWLQTKKGEGRVEDITPFWVFNGLAVTATQDVIQELAARADVRFLTPDEIAIVPAAALGPPQPNLSVIKAPALWEMGFHGQGVVVASLDSGVDVSHPDLVSRWRGGTNSWFDPHGEHLTTPTDSSGHGTWTMGVMVGGDASGLTVGVAPQAQWIAVKILDDQGRSTATAIHLGLQWLLDPDGDPSTADAPHVVNNSWTYAYPGCYLDFELDMQSLRAAGIVPVFAAGNSGPSSGSSLSPANNPSALAVGATDNQDVIYAYSSRGPSSCGQPSAVFPDLVAPGVGIPTTDLHGSYTEPTGTSMSAPHVAGALALLRSALPDSSMAELEAALINSAVDLGSPGPDDDYGYGRLDLLGAFGALGGGLPGDEEVTVHVGDLDGSSTPHGRARWKSTVTITVHDSSGSPVRRAMVRGIWSDGASGKRQCRTNANGVCRVFKRGLKNKVNSVTFTVDRVRHRSMPYDPSANSDPDGDSDGTTIVLSRS